MRREEDDHLLSKKVIASAILFFMIMLFTQVICNDVKPDVRKKYCREKERLITSEELDEYLLVDAEINSTIILECRFCEDMNKEQQQPKMWYWQDLNQSMELREVELGMDNNASLNRIRMTGEYSLVIRAFFIEDAGIYECFGAKGQERENKYNYRLEPVFDEDTTETPKNGSLKEWEKYREINLVPVTEIFAVSNIREFVAIRKAGITLELVSEWGPWGPCGQCVHGKGIKTRRGFCRIKSRINEDAAEIFDSDILEFFQTSPLLPCRSRSLQERFPSVSNATRHLSEFVLAEKCKPCKKKKKPKKHKFKYKKRYLLAEGAHLAIPCPEATVESDVVWRKDSLILPKGKGRSFRKKDPIPRVLVDLDYTLYLKDVSEYEQGKYTCFVEKERMLQAKVIVVKKQGLLTEAFVRHLGYLGFLFFVTSLFYCVGVVTACKNPSDFKTYEQITEDEKLLAHS